MPTASVSPYKQKAVSPLPPAPPPKVIDLNSSTKSTDRDTGAKITRRAFLCDIVIDKEGEETSVLLAHLGQPLTPLATLPVPPPPSNSRPTTPLRLSHNVDSDDDDPHAAQSPGWSLGKNEEMSRRLGQLIEELVRTERSYYSRVEALKTRYADPLRRFAKDPNHQLIPLYEANTLFANIDSIVPASAAFLVDLENMWRSGSDEMPIGDVCLHHLKDLKTFDPYRAYISKQDESQKTLQEVLKRFSGFSSFIESTKYQTTGIGNIGLRELLMEPVQRIPRYTLLWQTMVKCMSPISTQRAKLLEAVDIGSRIAKCDADAQTVRATVMYCLQRHVDGFPAQLFSNSRNYLDSIDVDDVPVEYQTVNSPPRPQSYTPSRSLSIASDSTNSVPSLGSFASSSHLPTVPNVQPGLTLHCSLFLFDDKLMIVKRQSSSISGRRVTGLDDVQKLVKSGGGVAIMDKTAPRKDKLSFKGVVDLMSVIVTDVGNGDFHLFMESPPTDQSERWSGRPFRSFTTVHPPFPISLDFVGTRRDKLRFVQNLWAAQALVRTKVRSQLMAVPRVLAGDNEVGLERAGEPMGRARCYYNVWERRGWMEASKARVVILVDEDGMANELPTTEGNPRMTIRLQPMSGGLCRFSYHVSDVDEEERTVIDVTEVADLVITTIHRYGVFRSRTSGNSQPTTPSSTAHRLRPTMLNLDTISRNLFGGSVSTRTSHSSGETTATSSTKRIKSSVSQSSSLETNRYSMESAMSTSEDGLKRLSRQSSSPSEAISSKAQREVSVYHDSYDLMGQSEVDLNARLNLARKNSKSAAASPLKPRGRSVAQLRTEVEAREKLDETELFVRSTSEPESTSKLIAVSQSGSPVTAGSHTRAPSPSHAIATSANQSFTGILLLSPRQGDYDGLSARPASTPNNTPLSPRPQGPRGLPALPRSPISPAHGTNHTKLRVVSGGGRRVSVGRETVPLKGENTPHDTPTIHITAKRQHSTDQLSPRKRSPSRSPLQPRDGNPGQVLLDPLHVPSLQGRNGSRRASGGLTPRQVSSGDHSSRRASATSIAASSVSAVSAVTETTDTEKVQSEHVNFLSAAEATRQKILDSRAVTSRLRNDIKGMKRQISQESKGRDRISRVDRAPSLPRSPQSRNINRRVDLDLRPHDHISSPSRHLSSSRPGFDTIILEDTAKSLSNIADKLDGILKQALADSESSVILASKATADMSQRSKEILALQAQVARVQEHRDLVQQQLADAQLELDVTYDAFNEELDGMYNEVQLPSDGALQALRRDLQITKARRNELQLENIKMKRDLAEAYLKREEWAKTFRAQGISPPP